MPQPRRLTEDQIVEILQSTDPHRVWADRLGFKSHQPIIDIRMGRSYKDIAPDIPRMYTPRQRRSPEEMEAAKQRRLEYLRERRRKQREAELARGIANRTCLACIHHRWRVTRHNDRKIDCYLEFPEPRRQGAKFARWCACYTEGR